MHFIILGFFFFVVFKFVFMGPASLGQVFFTWMLFFITLGNCAISKSDLLSNLDGNIIRFSVFFNVFS
jgi:hypothetical protein